MALLDAAKKPDGTTDVGRMLLGLLRGDRVCGSAKSTALRWQHVDLGTGSLHVVDAKTAKGIREVHLTPALREELAIWRADAEHAAPGDFVIPPRPDAAKNPVEPAAAPDRRRRRRERHARRGGDRADGSRDVPLAPPHLCEPPLRLRVTTSATRLISSDMRILASPSMFMRRRRSAVTGSLLRSAVPTIERSNGGELSNGEGLDALAEHGAESGEEMSRR